MFAVFKKEFKSYFLSPIGYIFIGIFLLIFSIFFMELFSYGVTNYEYLFGNGVTVLTFIVPVLTMRLFSEERKNGTEQLILTSPRSLTSVVIGKFLAAVAVLAVMEISTLLYFGIFEYFGEPSILISLTTLLGFLLLGMAYISFGMFASSLVENQIIAAVISVAAFLAMWFVMPNTGILGIFNLMYKFNSFPYGLIGINDLICFVSFTILFITLTIIVMQRKKSVR